MKLVHIFLVATAQSISLLDRIKSRYKNVFSEEEKKETALKSSKVIDRPISSLNNPLFSLEKHQTSSEITGFKSKIGRNFNQKSIKKS